MRRTFLIALAVSLAWHLWLLGSLAVYLPTPASGPDGFRFGLLPPGSAWLEKVGIYREDPLLALAPGDPLETVEALLPVPPPAKGVLYEPQMAPGRQEVLAMLPGLPEPAAHVDVRLRPALLEPLSEAELLEENF